MLLLVYYWEHDPSLIAFKTFESAPCHLGAHENRRACRMSLWVKSGKVQTEHMFTGLCLKADARRFEGADVSNIR
jgi:hypothetical protein